MKSFILTLIFVVIYISSFYSQALRGSAKLSVPPSRDAYSESTTSKTKAMKYGNVEAYDKNNKLVGSVLTDENGNYSLNFKDSGTYNIKIMYAGYETIEESVTVVDNEVSDFSLDRDIKQKERVLSEKAYSIDAGYLGDIVYLSDNNAQLNKTVSGKGLTSGEINDFAQWDLWNDYLISDLATYQKTWIINPQNRYVVQLINIDKNPLVGAMVRLISNTGVILWETLSDNTGKAELWGKIKELNSEVGKISVEYKGNTKEIRNPKPFQKGINTIRLQENCGASNIVDIAFVVDATGSMSDEINFIKRDLNKVMYEAQNLYSDVSIRYGSVFYRDKGEKYITKYKDFTNVLSEALVFVDEQFAQGGGDMPEAVDQGLDVAINQMTWSKEARSRLLFLILDAPPHTDPENLERIQALSIEAAKKGIKIIPITGSGINKSGEYLMRSLALCTNGTYVFLTDNSGIGFSHIAPSIDEYDVQLLTSRMTSIIKSAIFYPECDDTLPDYEMIYPDSLVEFTLETGQIYPSPTDIDSSQIQSKDSVGRDGKIIHIPIYQVEDKIEWKYYPNPTKDYVHVEAPEEIEYIYLTDLSGKILQRIVFEGRGKASIYLGDYAVGIYLLRYPIGKQWVTGKVILTR